MRGVGGGEDGAAAPDRVPRDESAAAATASRPRISRRERPPATAACDVAAVIGEHERQVARR
jgi:hypothetical protein